MNNSRPRTFQALRRRLKQRVKLLGPFFVAKVETERTKTVTICNLTPQFSAFGEVIAVVGYYQMRGKGMTAYSAVSVFIVTGARVVFVHGMTPDFSTGCGATPGKWPTCPICAFLGALAGFNADLNWGSF